MTGMILISTTFTISASALFFLHMVHIVRQRREAALQKAYVMARRQR